MGITANVAHGDEDSDITLIGSYVTSHKNECIPGLGYTYHIYSNQEFFFNFEELKGIVVYISNNTFCKIKGTSEVWLQMHGETIRGLIDILFVFDKKKNFISLEFR